MGWERESTRKADVLRTHTQVAMGAALIVSIAERVFCEFQHSGDALQVYPLRLLEAIAAAVGFLGARTIFVSRNQDNVKGLTTAASMCATVPILAVLRVVRIYLEAGAKPVERADDPAVTMGIAEPPGDAWRSTEGLVRFQTTRNVRRVGHQALSNLHLYNEMATMRLPAILLLQTARGGAQATSCEN